MSNAPCECFFYCKCVSARHTCSCLTGNHMFPGIMTCKKIQKNVNCPPTCFLLSFLMDHVQEPEASDHTRYGCFVSRRKDRRKCHRGFVCGAVYFAHRSFSGQNPAVPVWKHQNPEAFSSVPERCWCRHFQSGYAVYVPR